MVVAYLCLVIYPYHSHAELVLYDENRVDAVSIAKIERFLRQNAGHRNQSSLSPSLNLFFYKVSEHAVYNINKSGLRVSTKFHFQVLPSVFQYGPTISCSHFYCLSYYLYNRKYLFFGAMFSLS